MNNYMEDEQIIDFIKNYINKTSYNYAVLIDGGWGSGKTYFIENYLIPNLKEYEKFKHESKESYKEKKVIYISLYGISSREELDKLLFVETIPAGTIFKSKGFKIASNLSKTIIGGALSYAGISLEDNNFDLSNIVSLENCILIFDDLERCNINVNEVLGYINNFVEHDGIKVIIAANEKEIATPQITMNRELKYLVASNENIRFSNGNIEKKKRFDYSNLSKECGELDNKISIKELDKRINLLFGNDELYKLIKEKLIGVTIYYKPEITKIIESIERNNNNTNIIIKEVILNNKEFIRCQFEHYKHQNIRTLLFGLGKFDDLLINLENEIEVTEYIEVLTEILKYIIKISIIYKSGRALHEWTDDKEIDTIDLVGDNNIRDYIKGFKFIDNFLLGSVLDKEKAISVISREMEILKQSITNPRDPLNILDKNWFCMNDEDVVELINKVNLTLENNPEKYHINHYSKILLHNIELSRLGVISDNTKNILEVMKNNIKRLNIDYTFNTFGYAGIFQSKEDKLEYDECIKELNNMSRLYQEEKNINKLGTVFNNINNWADELYYYASENINKTTQRKAFLSMIEYERLINAIRSSNSSQICKFREIILNVVYNFSNINDFYKSDIERVKEIIRELDIYYDEIRNKQKIKANNIHYLINDLNNILKNLEK